MAIDGDVPFYPVAAQIGDELPNVVSLVGAKRDPSTSPVGDKRWTTMTFLAALRHDRVEAPWLLEGPINGDSFGLYVDQVLIPTLQPGDIVTMDDLGPSARQT